MATQITQSPLFAFLRPLSEVLLMEQNGNAQIRVALCLACAIEAAPRPDVAHMLRLLPRLVKLLQSPSFKAKPALLSVVVPCLVEFLSSNAWATRKAATDALTPVAVA